MSREACHRLLVFSLGAKDNNELGSWHIIIHGCFASITKDENKPPRLLSYFTFFSSGAKDNRLVTRRHFHFFP
jgi:hypothetical protein